MKVKLFTYTVNMGDGSAYPTFYATREPAEKRSDWEAEHNDGWGEDCVGEYDLEFDETGKLINGNEVADEEMYAEEDANAD